MATKARPICTDPEVKVEWLSDGTEYLVHCPTCNNSVLIVQTMFPVVEQARAGKGPFAAKLSDISRAIQKGAISEITSEQQVLADLDEFLRDEKAGLL